MAKTKQEQLDLQRRTLPPEDGGAPNELGDLESKPPKFGTARPAGPGDLPRVVDQIERAEKGSGERRYKISCRNYSPQKTRYILAVDRESAVEHYLQVNGLAALVARLRKQARDRADDVEEPDLVVVELAD